MARSREEVFAYMSGFDEVIKALNEEILKMGVGAYKGLIRSADWVRKDMDESFPKIPVDTGFLRSTWKVRLLYEGVLNNNKFGIEFGFTAPYALWVHEMVGADFTSPRYRPKRGEGEFQKPAGIYIPREGAGAKFLEAAILTNLDIIMSLVEDDIKSAL